MSASLRETEELKKNPIAREAKDLLQLEDNNFNVHIFPWLCNCCSLVYSRRIIYFFKKPLSFASNKSRPDLGSIEITHVRSSLSHLSGIKESK